MYQLLFNIYYRHEYFNHKPTFNMNCGWGAGMARLINNMGLLIVPSNGKVSILFDQSKFEREKFLDIWEDEILVIYFTPKENRIFYNVTKGLEKLIHTNFSKHDGDENKVKHFKFYQYSTSNSQVMDGVDLPVNVLKKTTTLEDFGEIDKPAAIKLQEYTKKLTEIKEIAEHKTLFVVGVKIKELLTANNEKIEEPSLTLQFKAVEAHYKYYFTAMLPDEYLQVIPDDNQDDVVYQAVTGEVFGDRSIAAFISKKPIALRLQNKKYFKLVRQVENVSQTLIEKLPHPDPTRRYKHEGIKATVLESFIN